MQITNVLALFAAASTTAALPAKPIARRDEVSDIVDEAQAIADNIMNMDVEQIEATFKAALGEALQKIESQIDGSLAGKIQEILDNGIPPEAVAKLIEAIDKIKEGVDVDAVNAWIKEQTDGIIDSIEDALGVDNISEIIQDSVQKRQIMVLYEAIEKINDGVSLEKVNAWLSEQTDGKQTDLLKALNVDSVDELIEDKEKRSTEVFDEALRRLKNGEDPKKVNAWVAKKTDGKTTDILKALGVDSLDELFDKVEKRQVSAIYQAIDKLRDGQSLESVNKWLYEQTSGKIKDILKALGVDSIEEALGSKEKRSTDVFNEAIERLRNGEDPKKVNEWVAKETDGKTTDILKALGVDSLDELFSKMEGRSSTPAKRQISTLWEAMEKVRSGVDIKKVNAWLKKETDGRITDLLDTLGLDSVDELMDEE